MRVFNEHILYKEIVDPRLSEHRERLTGRADYRFTV